MLPISSKACVRESRILTQVERWSSHTSDSADSSRLSQDTPDDSTPDRKVDKNFQQQRSSFTGEDTTSSDGDVNDSSHVDDFNETRTSRTRRVASTNSRRKRPSFDISDSETSDFTCDLSLLAKELLESWSSLPVSILCFCVNVL